MKTNLMRAISIYEGSTLRLGIFKARGESISIELGMPMQK
jgi:hypothetical protein